MFRPLAAAAAIVFACGAGAYAQTGKVTVVTSFSKDVHRSLQEGVREGLSGRQPRRCRTATPMQACSFIDETKGNNQIDLFWASAPDAFEVLKGKKLLQAYKPKATGIPEKIGSYPVNDKDGYYFGFAASGYGIMWNERYAQGEQAARAEGMAGPRQARLLRPRVDRRALALRHHAPDHRDDPAGRGLGQGLAHHQGDGRQFPQRHRALVRRAGGGELRPGRRRHRHRLLRLLGAGRGLSGEVRLSHR